MEFSWVQAFFVGLFRCLGQFESPLASHFICLIMPSFFELKRATPILEIMFLDSIGS